MRQVAFLFLAAAISGASLASACGAKVASNDGKNNGSSASASSGGTASSSSTGTGGATNTTSTPTGTSTGTNSGGAGGSTGSGGSAASCLGADDCKLFASYCDTAPCECLVMLAIEPDPICNGEMVTCFGNPCLDKSVDCVAGSCVLVE